MMAPTDTLDLIRDRLRQSLAAESAALAPTLRLYAWRAGLAPEEDLDLVSELTNQTALEALEHADRYDPRRPARAWLLGIAANLVRQRAAEKARLQKREPLATDLV